MFEIPCSDGLRKQSDTASVHPLGVRNTTQDKINIWINDFVFIIISLKYKNNANVK